MAEKRLRSLEFCAYCKLKYERFRSHEVPSFLEAYGQMLLISREAHANGDHSVRAYRGTALGLMRLAKQAAWKEHLYYCAMEQAHKEAEAAALEAANADIPF